MSELMDKILAAKALERKRLAALPFSEKVAILEKLRDRSLLIAKSNLRQKDLISIAVDSDSS
jgi:hypothetical protein